MKKTIAALLLIISTIFRVCGQSAPDDRQFTPAELREDLAFLKQQLYNVHAYPYTEFTQTEYDALFSRIDVQLTGPLTATAFLKQIKPAIAHLCDEHAQAYLPDKLLSKSYQTGFVFLPITLSRKGEIYRVDKDISAHSGLKPGEVITAIDGKPIKNVIADCALFTSGYPDQRLEKALLQFGYLYTWALPDVKYTYAIKTGSGKTLTVEGVALKIWETELGKESGWDTACDEKISYQKIDKVAYINACSFNIPPKQLDSIRKTINGIFDRIQKDKPEYLFIDISKNSGGQSIVGDMLMDGFNNKVYSGFSYDFKKSEEYMKLIRSWGIKPQDYYKNAPDGKLLHFESYTVSQFADRTNRFKGKVFIIIGKGTFSSAMMMATTIKDNRLATIVGETPVLGHPNGFGELYNTMLPNSKINLLFGVKRWIRPSGNLNDNLLRPDIAVKLTDDKKELIKNILAKAR
jgi:C-terminal processing protease CtpA/Prc